MSIRTFEGHTPRIADSAYVDEQALVIGDVHLGDDSSVWPMTVIRGDVNSIRIGARTNIQDGSIVHVTHDCEYSPGGYAVAIGDEVTVGHRVVVHACEIGDRCLIGMGSVILDGAIIGPDSMIGAGCLVPPGKRLEGGCLWIGSPAQKLRELSPEELEFLRYSAAHYVDNKNRHKADCS